MKIFSAVSGPSPLLTIITRMHPDRPTLQQRCLDSVRAISDTSVQHLAITTDVSGNMEAAEAILADDVLHRSIAGEYVYVLDDDDEIVLPEMGALWSFLEGEQGPSWVMVAAKLGGPGERLNGRWPRDHHPQKGPSRYLWADADPFGSLYYEFDPFRVPWQPEMGNVSILNLLIRRDVFIQHAHAFARKRPGDFEFVTEMWEAGIRPVWTNLMFAKTQRISKGASE
jgi:hypothetical protein